MAAYNPLNPEQATKAITYFFVLIFGQKPFELRVLPQKASKNQLGYLHILIGIFALRTGYDFQESKDYYKAVNSAFFFEMIEDKLRGGYIERIKSTADLKTDELAITISAYKDFAAENGIDLPPPDRLKALQSAKIELINNRVLLKIPKSIKF